jgi:glycosyltransferase involved in cell wall biosynthesis
MYKVINNSTTRSNIKVSVVIPVFNELNYIKRTLDSFNKQLNRNFEVIIVDNGSSDNIQRFIKIYKKTLDYNIFLITEKHPGPGLARKKGFNFILKRLNENKEINNINYFATTDADVVVPSDWINKIIDGFENNYKIGALAGSHKAFSNVDKEIKATMEIPLYFNIIPLIIQCFQKYNIGKIKLSSSNCAFRSNIYAESKGFTQPYNFNGTVALHEAELLGNKILSNGYIVSSMHSVVQSSRRRHLYNLINSTNSYYIFKESRFLSIREDEKTLLQIALESVSQKQWIQFRENMINIVINNILSKTFKNINDLDIILKNKNFTKTLNKICDKSNIEYELILKNINKLMNL